MRRFKLRGTTVELIQQARRLRHDQTSAEEVLWQMLRDRQLDGIKFRRQCPVERFIFDFYCPAAGLVIELDGPVHDQQRDRNAARAGALESHGYRVIHFRNGEVFIDLPTVLGRILTAVRQQP